MKFSCYFSTARVGPSASEVEFTELVALGIEDGGSRLRSRVSTRNSLSRIDCAQVAQCATTDEHSRNRADTAKRPGYTYTTEQGR